MQFIRIILSISNLHLWLTFKSLLCGRVRNAFCGILVASSLSLYDYFHLNHHGSLNCPWSSKIFDNYVQFIIILMSCVLITDVLNYHIIELSNYRVNKLWDSQIFQSLSNYRVIKLSNFWMIKLSNCRFIDLSNYRIIDWLHYQIIEFTSYRFIAVLRSNHRFNELSIARFI